MTDGNDDSSLLNTNSDPLDAVNTLVTLAQNNHVAIYCVAFGNNVNTNSLQLLTSQTGGRYYLAATTSDLAAQFQRIQKDISGQYVLRWATLKRRRCRRTRSRVSSPRSKSPTAASPTVGIPILF